MRGFLRGTFSKVPLKQRFVIIIKPEMNVAIIDIGTNNTRIAVFDITGCTSAGDAKIILEQDNITRIGENLRQTGRLGDEPMRRTLDMLAGYKKEAASAGADRIVATGTAAMRAASNSADFVSMARGIGIDIEIIPGEIEAELSFRGVLSGMTEPPDRLMVIDIGGGSSEFALGGREGLIRAESIPMGAVVATEKYFNHDPAAEDEIKNFHDFICGEIKTRIAPHVPEGVRFTGVAGTVSTLAMIDLGLEKFDSAKVHGHILHREKTASVTKELLRMTTEQRRAIPGMEPLRADIIHAGIAILDAAFEVLNIDTMLTSLCDLRHGILDREIKKMRPVGN